MRILIFIFFIIYANLFASPFLMSDLSSKSNLINNTTFIRDFNNSLTANEVLVSKNLEPVQKSNLGNINYPVWSKFEIKNDTNEIKKAAIVNIRPGIDFIDVYLFDKNKTLLKTYKLGSVRSIDEKPLFTRQSAFDIDIEPNSSQIMVAKITSSGTMDAAWDIYTCKEFMQNTTLDMLAYGAFIGIILALAIYSFTLFIAVHDKTVSAYIVFILTVATHQFLVANLFGLTNLFNNQILINIKLSIALVGVAAYVFFFMFFFETKLKTPKLYNGLFVLTAILLLLVPINFISVGSSSIALVANISLLVALAVLFTLLFSTIYFVIQKSIGANFYIAGQLSWSLFGIYQILSFVGILQTTKISLLAPLIGLALDSIFLSLALGQKVRHIKHNLEESNKMMLIMSRFASIGQVVGNIAHQWKIPLVRLGTLTTELEVMNITKQQNNLNIIVPQMRNTLEFMSETINEFQEFYNTDKAKTEFSIANQILEIKEMLSGKIVARNCTIQIQDDFAKQYNSYKYALAQVLMIIIDNALDAAQKRHIASPKIDILISKNKNMKLQIDITDNCGGIKFKPIEKVFEMFVSEKETASSGIGLAISKKIIEEKLEGKITVKNTKDGACFSILLNLNN